MIYRVGAHSVRCGDIMDDLGGLAPGPVDFIYTDLPWGNLKYWATMKEKESGERPREVSLDAFLTRVFDVIRSYSKPSAVVFIEYGLKWRSLIEAQAYRVGLTVLTRATPSYGHPPRPHDLFVMSWLPVTLPDGYTETLNASSGYSLLTAAFAPFGDLSGKKVFDPCCGLGYTAQLAVDKGMIFYGNELNQKRLDKTMKRLKNG